MTDIQHNEIGRNDLCPCNSGKKFKNCHMRSFEPKESFEFVVKKGNKADHHLESPDGKNWHKVPGVIALRVWYKEKTYPEIQNTIEILHNKIPENRAIVKSRVNRLVHKLEGIIFHLDNFVEQEKVVEAKLISEGHASDHDSIVMDPKLIYELEAFLFQLKSCLDILAQTISLVYGLPSITTYSRDGDNLIKSLKQNARQNLKDDALQIVTIINNNKKWISDSIDMRDEVTHYSDLEGFSCFINHTWFGQTSTRVSYPSLPDGNRASKYMQQTWNKLLEFIKNMLDVLLQSILKQ